MGFSRIPERKSAGDMHHRGDLDVISLCKTMRLFFILKLWTESLQYARL